MKLFIITLLMFTLTVTADASGRRTLSDIPAGRKYVAITFDDGPNLTYTVQVLDKLAQHGAKATFYVQGQKITPATTPVLQRMIREGHDVCNHSWDHPTFGQLIDGAARITTVAEARTNLQRTSQAIYDATGYWPFSFRAPFLEWGMGVFGGIDVIAGLDREFNMAFIDTGIDPSDFNQQGNPAGIASNVTGRTDAVLDGGIILLHDCGGSRPGTVASLDIMLPALKARGFEIVTVRELFMVKGATPELFKGDPAFGSAPPSNGSGMWPRVNQRGEAVWRQWWQPDRLWPNNTNNWWTQDWWSCATPPWQRWNGTTLGACGNNPPPLRHTVTFNANGGSTVNSIQQSSAGASITLPTTTRTGFTFNGWHTAINCGGTLAGNAGASYTPQSNITLFACWQENGGGGQTRIVDVLEWGANSWNIEHNGNSTVNLNIQPGRVNFTLNRGVDGTPDPYSWAQAFVGFNAGDFVSAVSITLTYTSTRAIELILGDPALTRTGEGYMYPLTASNSPRTLTIPISDFAQPEWVSASNRRPNVLANISSVLFQATVPGQATEVIITELKFNHTGGGSVAITDGIGGKAVSRNPAQFAFAGISNGQINLQLQAGVYTVELYNLQGRLVGRTDINAVSGVNATGLKTDNLSSGIFILNVKQAGNSVLRHRIMMR